MDEELLGQGPLGSVVRRGGQVLFLPQSLGPAAASEALSAPISAPPADIPPPAEPPPDATLMRPPPPLPAALPNTLANPLAGLGVPDAGSARAAQVPPPAAAAAPPAPPDPNSLGNPLAGLGLPAAGAAQAPAPAGSPPPGLAALANPLAGLGIGAPTGAGAPAPATLPSFANPLAGLGIPLPGAAPSAQQVDVLTGADPADPAASAAAQPLGSQPSITADAASDDGADEIPPTPEEAEQVALLTKGILGKQQAEDEGELIKLRNSAIAQKEQDAFKARLLLDERKAMLTDQYAQAVTARADQNAKIAKQSKEDGISVGKMIVLAIGALGAALNRDPRGVQPLIDIFEAKAEKEAQRRVQEADRLEGIVKDRAGVLLSASKESEGLTDKLRIEKAAIMEEYARNAEAVAKHYQGETAFVEAHRIAAETRKRNAAAVAEAAAKQVDQETALRRIVQDDINSRRSATTAYARIFEDRRQHGLDFEQRARKIELEEQDLQLKKDQTIGERRVFGLPSINLDSTGAPVLDAKGRPTFSRNILSNTDGSEFRPPTKEEAVDARAAVGGANKAAQLIDKAITLIKNNGWSSDLIRSPEWQEVKSTFREIQLARKGPQDLGLGVITGPDMELLNDILGGDPTGVRDPTTSLRTARDNIMLGVNAKLVGMGYDGNTFSVPELFPGGRDSPTAQDTPAQKLLRKAQERGQVGVNAARNQRLLSEEDRKKLTGPNAIDPRALPTRGAALAIDDLGRLAASSRTPPEEKQQYIAAIRELAKDPSPEIQNRVRSMAAQRGIELRDGFTAPTFTAPQGEPPTKGVSQDLIRSFEGAQGRGLPGSAGISSGFSNLRPEDRKRVLAAIHDPRHEDAKAENFPTAKATIGIGKLIEAAGQSQNKADQEYALRKLEIMATQDKSAMIRRRIKRAAKENGIKLRIPGAGEGEEK